MKDVRIDAPAALWVAGKNATLEEVARALQPPSPEEIIKAQDVEIRRLRSELERLHINQGTIANAAVGLTHMLIEQQDRKSHEVRIPHNMRLKLDGAQIKLRQEPSGDIFVSYYDGVMPVWDGRAADD